MVGIIFDRGGESNMFTNMPQDKIKRWPYIIAKSDFKC